MSRSLLSSLSRIVGFERHRRVYTSYILLLSLAIALSYKGPKRGTIKPRRERAGSSCSPGAHGHYILLVRYSLYCVYERDGGATSSGSALARSRRDWDVLHRAPEFPCVCIFLRRLGAVNACEPDLRGSRVLTLGSSRVRSVRLYDAGVNISPWDVRRVYCIYVYLHTQCLNAWKKAFRSVFYTNKTWLGLISS